MANTLQSISLMAGVATNGMTVNAYHASRFALPATDAAVPDGLAADAGPFTSANDPVQGNGYWSGTVSDQEAYLFSASGGGDGHTYWLGPVTPLVSMTQQAYSASVDQTANRTLQTTNITAASNGQVLPQATVNVASTTGFTSSGLLLIALASLQFAVVAYTGTTATTFTGCTGGSGTLATNNVVYQGFQAAGQRRTVHVTAACRCVANGDIAWFLVVATRAGVIKPVGRAGIFSGLAGLQTYGQISFEVDPFGYYAGGQAVVGGSVTLSEWEELDQ